MGGVEVQLQAFLTSALDEGERSASRSSGTSAPSTRWTGECVWRWWRRENVPFSYR